MSAAVTLAPSPTPFGVVCLACRCWTAPHDLSIGCEERTAPMPSTDSLTAAGLWLDEHEADKPGDERLTREARVRAIGSLAELLDTVRATERQACEREHGAKALAFAERAAATVRRSL